MIRPPKSHLFLPFARHCCSFLVRIGVCVFAALVLYACRAQSSGDRLIVISPHPETTLYEFQWAFQPWYRQRTGRDIEIVWLDFGGSAKMLRFLYNEFARQPDGVNIDMIWGGGLEASIPLAARNLLQPYRLPEPLLRAIPSEYGGVPLHDPNYCWYGTALTGFGIIYNRRVLALQELPTPQVWSDLADPAFESWVGIADPRQSGTAHVAFEIILQAYGWEKGWELITALGANVKAFTRLASDVPRDVSLGEIAAGFCIDNYAYVQMALSGRDVLGYVLPEGLTILNPDGIAILKGAPNLKAAELFVEFVMSDAGQRLIMLPKGMRGGPRQFNIARMATVPRTYEEISDRGLVAINPFRLRPALSYDSAKSSARYELINNLIGVLVIENHELLKRAWRAMGACEAARRPILMRQAGRMPLDEAEALTLAREQWKDSVARNQILVEWSRFARQKYEAVLREAENARTRVSAAPADDRAVH